jgi:toxin ParE1/3/4
MPGLGRNRPDLAEDLKSFPTGNHVIFYRVVDGGIQILRVLHGARDIKKIFTQNSDPMDEDLIN